MLVLFVSSQSFLLYHLCHRPLLFSVAINFREYITDRSTLSLKHSLIYKSEIYPASTTTTYHLADSSFQLIFACHSLVKTISRREVSFVSPKLRSFPQVTFILIHATFIAPFPLFCLNHSIICYTSVQSYHFP